MHRDGKRGCRDIVATGHKQASEENQSDTRARHGVPPSTEIGPGVSLHRRVRRCAEGSAGGVAAAPENAVPAGPVVVKGRGSDTVWPTSPASRSTSVWKSSLVAPFTDATGKTRTTSHLYPAFGGRAIPAPARSGMVASAPVVKTMYVGSLELSGRASKRFTPVPPPCTQPNDVAPSTPVAPSAGNVSCAATAIGSVA